MILTYTEALTIVQNRLNDLEHTKLKSFCEEHDFTYGTVSNLRNNSAGKEMPLLVIKLLKAFGYKYDIKLESLFILEMPPHVSDPISKDIRKISTYTLTKKYKSSDTK